MSIIRYAAVASPLDPTWAPMTFPAYREALVRVGSTDPATGHHIVAHIAERDEDAVGLILATVSPGAGTAEIQSLFVAGPDRGVGVGTRLVAGLESDLASRGVHSLSAVYMTGRPSIDALERVFVKRAFSTPARRTVVVRFTPEEAARTDWYRRARLPAGATVFPWATLTDAERVELRRSQEAKPWIHPDLEPWKCDARFDEVSSVGLRHGGRVVGWVINHAIAPDMLCFTTSFMLADLARRGGIFPLYVASLERLRGTGVTCTFVTAAHFESMVRFVLRRCAPFVSFTGETRGVSKELAVTGRSA